MCIDNELDLLKHTFQLAVIGSTLLAILGWCNCPESCSPPFTSVTVDGPLRTSAVESVDCR